MGGCAKTGTGVTAPGLQRCEMKNGEKFFRIGPDTRELKAGRGGEHREAVHRVFVGKFRDDFFSGREMKFPVGQMNSLVALADQVHLDPGRLLVVDGSM